MKKKESLEEVHARAIRQFNRVQNAVYDTRMECLRLRRFSIKPGAQWEGGIGEQFENKTKLEINKIKIANNRIHNEYLNNTIGAIFTTKDGAKDNGLADACNALHRADEQSSSAQEAYDTAFREAVDGGIGAWRYIDDEDDGEYRIKISPIIEADKTVFFDLSSKLQDKSDAKRCWVLSYMDRDDYEEEHNDNISSWPNSIDQEYFDWATPDYVVIAEFYEVENVEEEIQTWKTIDGEDEEYSKKELGEDGLMETLVATGSEFVSSRKIERQAVHKYIMSRSKVIEDCGYIVGEHIPVVMSFGNRSIIDGTEVCLGHGAYAIDLQQVINSLYSKLSEISARSSTEKPIFDPSQITGLEQYWADDNIADHAFMLARMLRDIDGNPIISPLQYTRPPNIPPVTAALLQAAETDLSDLLGNNAQGDKMVSNISDKTVAMIQERVDMHAFGYISNHAKAVRRGAQIWLSKAKWGYTKAGRKMKGIGVGDNPYQVELKRPVINGETGIVEYENDLSDADFEVSIEIGAPSSSRRKSVVRDIIALMGVTSDQEINKILTSVVLMQMDGEGLSSVNEYFRKRLVDIGVVKPNDEEQKAMEEAKKNAQQDPNAEYLAAAAKESNAKAEKTIAEIKKVNADAELTHAKTIEILKGMESGEKT